MSVAVMGEVFKRYPSGGNEMLLALALADHASDDGKRIFPSVEALANKVRVSERTVQRLLIKMVDDGWLQIVRDSSGGRGQTRHYRINPAWINGDKLSPFKDVEARSNEGINGDKLSPFNESHTTETVTPRVLNGDIAMSPEPSEPSVGSSYELPTVYGSDQKPKAITWDDDEKVFVGVSDELMRTWEVAYKPLDVDAELMRMELWYDANPRKRKRNVQRFITGWLAKEVARRATPRRPPQPRQPHA